MAISRAHASWSGKLGDGSGEVSAQSRAFERLPLTWAARTERQSPERTSPEELIAAAHAGCYSMALAHALDQAGSPPERLEVDSAVHFTPQEGGGMGISKIELTVRATVPGLSPERFDELAAEGEQGCPVSNALRGGVGIDLHASLS
jgi:lipoyl-dependent peroxiredoxin